MASRGKQRKRSSRMHGAIDNMAPLGFAALFVRKTVRQLLKVYGGDEGWTLIEADGYKELIDAILCNQETNDEDTKKIEKEGVSSQDERAECNSAVNTVGEAPCFVPATAAGVSGSNSHVFAPPPTSSPCVVNYPKMCSGSQVQSGSNPHVSIPPPTSPPCPVNNLLPPADNHLTNLPSTKRVIIQPPSRRFPCYG